jgi:hypothetical protein
MLDSLYLVSRMGRYEESGWQGGRAEVGQRRRRPGA